MSGNDAMSVMEDTPISADAGQDCLAASEAGLTGKEQLDWRKFLAALTEFLNGQKGQELCVRYFAGGSIVADAMIIVTATSRRHAMGLADGVARLARESGRQHHSEGYDMADWILVDCGDVIVHIFQETTRQLYRLEDLWNITPEKELAQ